VNLQLGTAHFGNTYGLTNSLAGVSRRTAWDILALGLTFGINEVDTSPDYGDSLSIISDFKGGLLNVTTKIRVKGLEKSEILKSIEAQNHKINLNHKLKSVLIHDFAILNSYERESVIKLSRENKVLTIGISIYDPWELEELVTRFNFAGPVQIPINIVNQTFLGSLGLAKYSQIEFIGRSILLQGALDWRSPINKFKNHPDIVRFQTLGQTMGLNPIQLVVAFTKTLNLSRVIVGFNSEKQLLEFNSAWVSDAKNSVDFAEYNSCDENLFDPRRWN
jgi:aryl-alcohol dehydrogenase-like predicted oxidoreductase